MSSALSPLTSGETAQLTVYETTIRRGIASFLAVGSALASIRDKRLYRSRFDTFEDYCEKQWQISRPRAYQLIDASDTVSTIVDKINVPPPTNEGQARELSKSGEEHRAEDWATAHKATGGKPTAAAIAAAREKRAAASASTPPPPPSPPSSPPEPDPIEVKDAVVDALDDAGLTPDDPSAHPHAEWRGKFERALRGGWAFNQFTVEDIAAQASNAQIDQLAGVLDLLTQQYDGVVKARRLPANVVQLRAG